MNGDDWIKSLRARLGNRSVTDLPSNTIIMEAEAIRKTQMEKARFRPWFLQAEDTSIATVVGQEYVSLPTGFLGFDPEDEWSGVWYQNPNDTSADPWVKIISDDFNTIRDFYKFAPADQFTGQVLTDTNAVSGAPIKAGLVGNQLYLRPIPDQIYTLRYRFYKSDSPLVETATENLWLQHAHDWWMGEVGLLFASQYVQDSDLVAVFDLIRKEGRQRVYHETIARQEANKSRQQGDD